MILDMSPTSTGLLQQNDVDAYAGFGAGARALYPPQPAAESYPARGVSTVELVLPSSDVSRGGRPCPGDKTGIRLRHDGVWLHLVDVGGDFGSSVGE